MFLKALKANNLEIEEADQSLIIRKTKEKNTSIQFQVAAGVVGVIFGLGVLLFYTKAGMVILGASISLLFVTTNLRQREKDMEKKYIEIKPGVISIREGFKTRRVDIDNIAEFRTNTERHKNLFVGSISIITENQSSYEFLELYGDNEALLQDDLVIISSYVIDNYVSNSGD